MWHGPGGIGTTRGVDGFQRHHHAPFLHAFPDRGSPTTAARPPLAHRRSALCRLHRLAQRSRHLTGDYLCIKATGKPINMRSWTGAATTASC
ncbi:MAG TPA: hypothetical protein VK439_07440 [Rubrivivax sp.]|nr:hypothetical protein [Rubrivivax sp.]